MELKERIDIKIQEADKMREELYQIKRHLSELEGRLLMKNGEINALKELQEENEDN